MLDPRDLIDNAANRDFVPADAIPSATVILLRDGVDGIEVLMLRRNSKLDFVGGAWVFPGGRIDPDDLDPENPDDRTTAARRAAVRETAEEAGLDIDGEDLVWFSHWTAPPEAPKRFATWFFVTRAPDGDITVDDGEIETHGWFRPADALRRRNDLEIELAPPTWITLEHLTEFADVNGAIEVLAARDPEHFMTKLAIVDGGAIVMYHGDAGYEDGDADRAGGRHRLWMLESGWRYERSLG